MPAFPSFPTDSGPAVEMDTRQGTQSWAERSSGEDDASWQTHVQWRVKHSPTGTCYLKVWFLQTTFKDSGYYISPDDVTTDDSTTPYEWSGTGNPCISNPDDGLYSASNKISGDPNTMLPPTFDGTRMIEILKYSLVENYEPDVSDVENPQPNGYPDPAWEAVAP